LNWNLDGNLLVSHFKDKKIRVMDPRTGETTWESTGHVGPKKGKVVFCGTNEHYMTSAGYTKNGKGEVALWDLRNPEERV